MEKQPHIQLDENDIAPYAILVGDPKRVDRISNFLTNVKNLAFNREFKSLKGIYKDIPIIVISTGIGGVSTAIAVEELSTLGVKVAIRVGSCGAMQKGIDIGELVISQACVRDDGTSKQYAPVELPAVPDLKLLSIIKDICEKDNIKSHFGTTRSHDSFYIDNNDDVEAFWSEFGIIGGDMETSTLFIVGKHRGLKTASILNNVVLYQASLNDGVNDLVSGDKKTSDGEEASILLALNAIKQYAKEIE